MSSSDDSICLLDKHICDHSELLDYSNYYLDWRIGQCLYSGLDNFRVCPTVRGKHISK